MHTIPLKRRVLPLSLAVVMMVVSATAQDQEPTIVPPMEVNILTGEEYRAWKAHKEALKTSIARLEGKIEEKRKKNQDITSLVSELSEKQAALDRLVMVQDPDYQSLLPMFQEKTDFLLSLVTNPLGGNEPAPIGSEGADLLIYELYEDTGVPQMNAAVANLALGCMEITLHAQDPLSDSAKQILRDGLVQYVHDGGGTAEPGMELVIAQVLTRVATPDDEEAAAIAQLLYEDAQSWAEELNTPLYSNEIRAVGSLLEQQDKNQQKPPEGAPLFKRLDAANGSIQPDGVAALYTSVLAFSGDDALNKKMLRKLLVTYRRILLDRRTSTETAKTVDSHLLAIATSGKLETIRDWQCWAVAAKALRDRASPAMRKYVTDRANSGAPSMVTRALRSTKLAVKDIKPRKPTSP